MRVVHLLCATLVTSVSAGCGGGGGDGMGRVGLSPHSLYFEVGHNRPPPETQTVTVALLPDAHALSVGFEPEEPAPGWLHDGLESGSALFLQVSIGDTSLAPGTYHATLRIRTGPEFGDWTAYGDLPVTYSVLPVLAASETSLYFEQTFEAGGPAPQTLTLAHETGATVSWAASAVRDPNESPSQPSQWLRIDGGLEASGTAPTDVTISVAAGQSPGCYESALVFQTTGEEPLVVPVNYCVLEPVAALRRAYR